MLLTIKDFGSNITSNVVRDVIAKDKGNGLSFHKMDMGNNPCAISQCGNDKNDRRILPAPSIPGRVSLRNITVGQDSACSSPWSIVTST